MKLLGLLVLLFSSSLWASGGYNFFTNASHIFHIPAHTLALIFGSLVFLAVGVYYRALGEKHLDQNPFYFLVFTSLKATALRFVFAPVRKERIESRS